MRGSDYVPEPQDKNEFTTLMKTLRNLEEAINDFSILFV